MSVDKRSLDAPSHGPESEHDWAFCLTPIADKTRLEQDWRRLEAGSRASFFLSWDWIGCWLDHLTPHQHPFVFRAERAGRLEGLALLTPRRRRWLGIMPADGLHLHETGEAALDALTIEYNGILAEPAVRGEITGRAVEWLLSSRQCDELHLSGIPVAQLAGLDHGRFAVRLRDRKPSYAVNLQAIRTAGGSFMATLSANSRAQLRRAIRQFGALGELRIIPATTAGEALDMLARMIPLHQHYWQGKGHAGAFANPAFISFHRQLIRDGFDRGCVQLLRCDAGATVLGYLYNFIKDTRVYSYQNGFDYGLLPRAKPGWVCHHLSLENSLRQGMTVYDLLAGQSQFKASFAEPAENLAWATVERNGWKPSLMSHLRRVKRLLRHHSS